MCGIIGYLSPAAISVDFFTTARDRMFHRGPDDAGLWRNPSNTVLLGHRRLSIIDLSHTGHQPMASACGRYIIVFNGEVYNYLELKRELEMFGHRFKGTGDTEVVLAAYQQWGDRCLERFNGMFAIAIWDCGAADAPPSLFMARDRAGKKPFYYALQGQALAFASELKGIPQALRGGINLQALNHYLALGYVPGSLCIASGVSKLPPAHAARFWPDTGELSVWRWWSLPPPADNNGVYSGHDLAEQSWLLLVDAIRIRLRSDVPVGIFLSGGLDSSLVTAAAVAVSEQPICTFTIGVPGSKLDESHHAQAIADHFTTRHHLLELPDTSLDILDELAGLIDEPIADSSILPTYLISKLTAQHVKVALGGDGGDELYGGYGSYQQVLRDRQRLGSVPRGLFRACARLAAQLPAGVKGRNRLASLYGGVDQSPIWGGPYFDVALRRRILQPDAVAMLGGDIIAPELYQLSLLVPESDIVAALTRMDFQSVLPDDFLVKVDRASMANSLEVRTPFLDYRLVEHAYGVIQSNWKVDLKERRIIQNLMAKKYLPASYQLNRKQGFSVPMDEWLQSGNIGSRVKNLPSAIFNVVEINNQIRGQERGRANSARLFALMMLSCALKKF
jgi:asparagine synthase (glutamine-hydrolysing)